MLTQTEDIRIDELCVYFITGADDADRFYLEMEDLSADSNMDLF